MPGHFCLYCGVPVFLLYCLYSQCAFLLPPFTSSYTGRLHFPLCGSAWLQFLAWFVSCPVVLLATAPFSGPVRFSSYYLASFCILLRFLAPGFDALGLSGFVRLLHLDFFYLLWLLS